MKLLQSIHNPMLELQDKPNEFHINKISYTPRQVVKEELNLKEKKEKFDTNVESSIRGNDLLLYLLDNHRVSDPGITYLPILAVSRETMLVSNWRFSNAIVFNFENDGRRQTIPQMGLKYTC